jgi:hypothetical protein
LQGAGGFAAGPNAFWDRCVVFFGACCPQNALSTAAPPSPRQLEEEKQAGCPIYDVELCRWVYLQAAILAVAMLFALGSRW